MKKKTHELKESCKNATKTNIHFELGRYVFRNNVCFFVSKIHTLFFLHEPRGGHIIHLHLHSEFAFSLLPPEDHKLQVQGGGL